MTMIPVAAIRAAATPSISREDVIRILVTVLSVLPVVLGWLLTMLFWVFPSILVAAFVVGCRKAIDQANGGQAAQDS